MIKKNIPVAGFTLIELSIVLLIISLIAGGVATGRSLIRSAKIVDVIDDINQYQTAVKAFELEYNGLPGDLLNAAEYWPGQTHSGNGDGDIGDSVIGNTEAYYIGEDSTFFEHLSLANLTDGAYIGNGQWTIGTNLPKTSIENNTFKPYFNSRKNLFLMGDKYDLTYNNFLVYEKTGDGDNAISPNDAYRIDLKLDDGLPGVGNFTVSTRIVDKDTKELCAKSHTSVDMPTTKYDISHSQSKCDVVFPL